MIETFDAPINGARNHTLNPSEKLELVDAGDRRLPFSIETTNSAKLSVSVRADAPHPLGVRAVNNLSGIAGFWRVSPLEMDIEEWEGQVGQVQVINTALVAGFLQFDQDDVIVPPGANGIRISPRDAAVNYTGGTLTFSDDVAAISILRVPPTRNGTIIAPLLSNLFALSLETILADGSAVDVANVSVLVSFIRDAPDRLVVIDGSIEFSSPDNIAQATTYYFALPVKNLDKFKRVGLRFTYDYEDDANTAGGSVNLNAGAVAAAGGVAYVSWAFGLGTDVGADRRGAQAMNLVDPSDVCWISITNSDAAKDIDNWLLNFRGVDEQ